jgi:hypothetical protein
MHPRISRKRQARHMYFASKAARRSANKTDIGSPFDQDYDLQEIIKANKAYAGIDYRGFLRRAEEVRLANRTIDEVAAEKVRLRRSLTNLLGEKNMAMLSTIW